MLYRPRTKDWHTRDLVNFTAKRWIMLPVAIFLPWMETKGDLREPTPLPFSLKDDLKSGYYWPELIH